MEEPRDMGIDLTNEINEIVYIVLKLDKEVERMYAKLENKRAELAKARKTLWDLSIKKCRLSEEYLKSKKLYKKYLEEKLQKEENNGQD